MTDLAPLPLPGGLTSRFVDGVNGLHMHVLEAGAEDAPVVLLLHGFPELAYSWRRVMPALAAAGFRVIAPDQRGYGRTTGWDPDYGGDVASFRMLNLVTDIVALLAALTISRVEAVVGHDFGSPVAANCALMRPDLFKRVMLMSAPFAGPPSVASPRAGGYDLDAALAALSVPRKRYMRYFTTREANADMIGAPQGLAAFMRAYAHMKGGGWPENEPKPLPAFTAEAFATLPDYYVMPLAQSMPQAVARADPGGPSDWLTDADLAVYAAEYGRTGFQGGLNWYRCSLSSAQNADLRWLSGRRIEQPSVFVAGARDWGVHQTPGAFEAMTARTLVDAAPTELIPGAGHWVQQEAPEPVVSAALKLLARKAC